MNFLRTAVQISLACIRLSALASHDLTGVWKGKLPLLKKPANFAKMSPENQKKFLATMDVGEQKTDLNLRKNKTFLMKTDKTWLDGTWRVSRNVLTLFVEKQDGKRGRKAAEPMLFTISKDKKKLTYGKPGTHDEGALIFTRSDLTGSWKGKLAGVTLPPSFNRMSRQQQDEYLATAEQRSTLDLEDDGSFIIDSGMFSLRGTWSESSAILSLAITKGENGKPPKKKTSPMTFTISEDRKKLTVKMVPGGQNPLTFTR